MKINVSTASGPRGQVVASAVALVLRADTEVSRLETLKNARMICMRLMYAKKNARNASIQMELMNTNRSAQ